MNQIIRSQKEIYWQVVAIFFIQASSTIAYGVFYSGLSIFLTKNRHDSPELASLITGLFLSFNYFLPLLGGLIANRIVSYKKMYYIGSSLSFLGCLILAKGVFLYFALALFLMGSVVNICINMFVTQLFTADQSSQRQIAFTWNYVGMNLGFMMGYLFTGFSSKANDYHYLFLFISLMTLLSLSLTCFFIKEPKLSSKISKNSFTQITLCLFVFIPTIMIITGLFYYAEIFRTYITLLSIFSLILLMSYAIKNSNSEERKKITIFICFSLVSIVFWTMYMLTPLAIMQLIENGVQRDFLGFTLAPQWLVNIDSIVILTLAPLTTLLTKKMGRKGNYLSNTLNYFRLAFIFALVSFVILLIGLSEQTTKLPIWIALSYLVSMTLGEIFIYPASSSLVGELIQEPLRGLMTAATAMNLGIGGLLASIIASRFILPFLSANGISHQNGAHLQHVFLIISVALLFVVLFVPYLFRAKVSSIKINSNKALEIQ